MGDFLQRTMQNRGPVAAVFGAEPQYNMGVAGIFLPAKPLAGGARCATERVKSGGGAMF